MMRMLLGVLFFIGLVGSGHAAPRTLQPGESLEGHFTQERHLTGFETPIRSSGEFTLTAEGTFHWHTQEPIEVTLVIDDNGLSQQVAGQAPILLPVSKYPMMQTLPSLLRSSLGGDWKALEERFHTKPSFEGEVWTLNLTKRQLIGDMPLKALVIKGAEFVEQVEIERSSGDRDLLFFSEQQIVRSAGKE